MAAGRDHTVALKSDGTLWAWGRNDYGQLGDGTNTQKNTTVQIMDGVSTPVTTGITTGITAIITASAGNHGSIFPSGAVTVNQGESKTFAITPEAGYHVADVLVDGSSKGAVPIYTITNITAAHTIAASFAINTYTLTVSKSGTGTGIITSLPSGIQCGADCTEGYSQGTVVTLTATPGAGSTFTGWSGGGCSGTGTCQVTMNANTTVIATCQAIPVAQYTPGAQGCQSMNCHGGMTETFSHGTHLESNLRGTAMRCTDCHAEGKLVNPGLPCPRLMADGRPMAETTVCDKCHSPEGAFDGSNHPLIGAKANWQSGVYQKPICQDFIPGLENWCAGCHDNGTSICCGVSAPNVMGDNATYGCNITGHKIACTVCHDVTKKHIDGNPRTYSHDSNPLLSTDSHNYQNGYRLKYGMMIPLSQGPKGGNAKDRFTLCFKCHDYDKLMGSVAPQTNFQNQGVNRHLSHISAGRMAWDSDWDYLQEPDQIIVDNSEAVFIGNWPSSTTQKGYYGTDYQWHAAGNGTSTVTWIPQIPSSGEYKVYAQWTAQKDQASNAQYSISYDGGTFLTEAVNQRINGGNWTLLGTFFFAEGNSGYVKLSDQANGAVVADAVRFGDPILDSRISCPTCHNVHGSSSPAMIRHGELIHTPGTSNKNPDLNFQWYKSDGFTPTILGVESVFADMPVMGGPSGGNLENNMICVGCHSGPVSIKYSRVYQPPVKPSGSWLTPSLPPSVRCLKPQPGSQDIAPDRSLSFMLLSNGLDAVDWTTFSISLQGTHSYSQTYTAEDTDVVSIKGTSHCYQVTVYPRTAFGDLEQIMATLSIQDHAGNMLTSPSWSFTTAAPSSVIWKTPEAIYSEYLFGSPEYAIDDHPETGNVAAPFSKHWVIFDLGQSYKVSQVRLLLSSKNNIRLWNIFVSDNLNDWGAAVKTNWKVAPEPTGTKIIFTAKRGRYLKLLTERGPLLKDTLMEVDFAAVD